MQENRVPRGMRHKTRINIEVFGLSATHAGISPTAPVLHRADGRQVIRREQLDDVRIARPARTPFQHSDESALIKITVFEKRAKTHLGGFWPVRTFTNACFLCEFVKAKRPLGQSPSLCLVVDDFRKKVWERNTEQIEGWKGHFLIV
jgi:hypothetical protein